MDIADNVLPDAQPEKIAHPSFVLVTALLTGPVLGSYFMYRNAVLLGCRDAKRQGVVLLIGAVVAALLFYGVDWISANTPARSMERFGGEMLLNVCFLIMLGCLIYCSHRQERLFKLHKRETGKSHFRLVYLGTIILSAWAVTFVLLALAPPLGEAMGGLAIVLN